MKSTFTLLDCEPPCCSPVSANISTLFFPPNPPVFSNGLYHIDQKSMTGIIVGVSIALACILMCALILISKGRPRWGAQASRVLYTGTNNTSSDLCRPFASAGSPLATKSSLWEERKSLAALDHWPLITRRRTWRPWCR